MGRGGGGGGKYHCLNIAENLYLLIGFFLSKQRKEISVDTGEMNRFESGHLVFIYYMVS